jgi:hypothetical protein
MVGVMGREFYDSIRYPGSQNAVATTWLVSFDQIRRTDKTAAELLSFISQIEPKAIPRSIYAFLPCRTRVGREDSARDRYALWVRFLRATGGERLV